LSHPRDGAHAWFSAGLLAVAYAVAFIDRQVLNLLVDPIKMSMGLSDTSVSLLQGLAFVTAYVAMGPVFGRLADRGNRRNLLIAGVAIWSVCTVACGFARDFWTLFAARAGVGAAEACLLPAGWSLLADNFSRERLPRAMSIFLLGPFVGGGLAMIFGGLIVRGVAGLTFGGPLAGLEPWGLTFVFLGLPGLLLAALMFTIREPGRGVAASGDERAFSPREALAYLWAERAFYGRFFGGMALLVVALYALPAWTPAFLMRAHGGTAGSVGLHYGTATLLAGSLGVLLGPWVAARLRRRYPDEAPVRTTVVAGLGIVPLCLFLPFAPGYWSALCAAALAGLFVNLTLPVVASALADSTPNRMHGIVASVYAFVLTSTGIGLAPTLVALVTDHILLSPARVGTSLGFVCATTALVSLPVLVTAARLYARRLEAARS